MKGNATSAGLVITAFAAIALMISSAGADPARWASEG
jgi:uncharacterized membrane protein